MKKFLISNRVKYAASVVSLIVTAVVFFQNCGSKVTFSQLDSSSSAASSVPTAPVPQYAEVTSGDQSTFPPLKLIFVVDNSNSMYLNQVNLSNAFSKMFEDSNATNLAPFDSTAYIISTSQRSLRSSDNAADFARLPTKPLTDYATMSLSSILSGPRAQILDGSIAGDLVGFRLNSSTDANGLSDLQYIPAPVANFAADGNGGVSVSLAAHKTQNGSVNDFEQDFISRIAVLDPNRSALDSSKNGVLDAVVNNESGLCALSRVLRHQSDFIKPGDMAAYVIVSDEDDNDPKGLNCVESFQQTQSSATYVNGTCTTPGTNLQYYPVNPTPSAANCSVQYDTGFKYTYTYPQAQTTMNYYLTQRNYTIRQTNVAYSYATYTYPQANFTVSYFTKDPTYNVQQTVVDYYTKNQTSCTPIRDTNQCTPVYTYAAAKSAPIKGTFTDCTTFLKTNTPAGAVTGDSAHPITCETPTLVLTHGACDSSMLNCNQNISTAMKTSSAIKGTVPADATSCATAEAALNDSSAVLNDSAHAPKCVAAASTTSGGDGLCPSGVANCTAKVTVTTAKNLTGVPASASAADCMAFAKTNSSSLNKDAIFDNSSYAVTCTEGTGVAKTNETGVCSTLSATADKNCSEHPSTTLSSKVIADVPAAGQTCAAFIQANVTSVISTAGASCPAAAPLTKTSSAQSISYTDASVASYTAAVNGNCLAALGSKISQASGLPLANVLSCTVTALVQPTKSYNTGKTCDQIADTNSYCDTSKGANRNCVATSVAAGSPYLTTLISPQHISETLTCATECSDTKFCSTKSGTVADNYKGCIATADNSSRTVTHVPSTSALCNAGEIPAAGQPYHDAGLATDYVAGTGSATGVPNALATYVKDASTAIFGTNLPSVSVFASQSGDNLGISGSVGVSYNTFATMMGGTSQSVHASATGYASALQNLSSVVREKLNRSFSVQLTSGQAVYAVQFRKAGTTDWGQPLDPSEWSASGGTVTMSPSFNFTYGDQFRVEFY